MSYEHMLSDEIAALIDKLEAEIQTRRETLSGLKYVQTQRWLATARQEAADEVEADDDLVIGNWPCSESPVHRCVYNHTEDPCHDFCIFCGDPSERK